MKQENNYNPNNISADNGNIFGYPYSCEDASLILLPVPWDVTASYGSGTSNGPEAILNASPQLDFADIDINNAYKISIAMNPISETIKNLNDALRPQVDEYQRLLAQDSENNAKKLKDIKLLVDQGCQIMNEWVEAETEKLIKQGKMVGIIGGEHSVSYGFAKTLGKYYEDFGILQIDAHADLRNAYEGLEFSHASAMFNILDVEQVSRIVQVGIRDFCEEEKDYILEHPDVITTFFDADIKTDLFEGYSWANICDEIIDALPQNVFISFDIDGLLPYLCPNTGTPVPGGLEFAQVIYLIKRIAREGKTIIGFDLCEVAPGKDNEWDANVGARIAWALSVNMALSQGF